MANSSDTSGYPNLALFEGAVLGLALVILAFAFNFVRWLLLPIAVPSGYFDWVGAILASKNSAFYSGITLFWGVLFLVGYPLQAKTFTRIGAALSLAAVVFFLSYLGCAALNGALG